MAKKIMVVDDEEDLLILVKGVLESEGYTVSTKKNGQECLASVKTEKPDLIILDMMMPGMSGREAGSRHQGPEGLFPHRREVFRGRQERTHQP